MEEQKFKPGDVVQLKSGGPEMTVVRYEPADGLDITCTWFNNNDLKEKSFHQDLLDLDTGLDVHFN